jgi:Na+-driven multidrug efflux pump
VKPTWSQFLAKPNKHSFKALKCALSQLIANLTMSLPTLIVVRFLAEGAMKIGKYETIMAAWNVIDRIYIFVVCVCLALNQGLLPAASFAFGSSSLKRLLRLALVTLALGTGWSLTCCTLIVSIPKQIARIWGSNPEFLDICGTMLFRGFITCWLNQSQMTLTTVFQSMKKVVLSVVASILMLMVPLPLFATILYQTDRDNPTRLLYGYVGSDLWGLVIVVVLCVWKLRFLVNVKDGEAEEEVEVEIAEDEEEIVSGVEDTDGQ